MKNEFKKPLIDILEIKEDEIISTSGEPTKEGSYNTGSEDF